MAPHLRLFRAQEETNGWDEVPTANVRVRLAELLPLVSIAQKLNYLWLNDFLDDEVCISEDLNEVLQSLRASRPSAS
jgi:hypothetical protein